MHKTDRGNIEVIWTPDGAVAKEKIWLKEGEVVYDYSVTKEDPETGEITYHTLGFKPHDPSGKPDPTISDEQYRSKEAGIARIPDWVQGRYRELMLVRAAGTLNSIDWSRGTSLGMKFVYNSTDGYDANNPPPVAAPGDREWHYATRIIAGDKFGIWSFFSTKDPSVDPNNFLPGDWHWEPDHETWADWTRSYMLDSGVALYTDLADGIPGFEDTPGGVPNWNK